MPGFSYKNLWVLSATEKKTKIDGNMLQLEYISKSNPETWNSHIKFTYRSLKKYFMYAD